VCEVVFVGTRGYVLRRRDEAIAAFGPMLDRWHLTGEIRTASDPSSPQIPPRRHTLGRPITLELTPGVRLEPDRRPAGSQSTLGAEVVAQNGDAPRVPFGLELPPDHHGVPDALGQQLIDDGPEGSSRLPRRPPRRAGAPPRWSARRTVRGWTPSCPAMSQR
jgi:hypothetical protein